MKRDETIQFLTLHGWEIYPNRPDKKIVLNKYVEFEDDEEWLTIEEALECERTENPEAFDELEMIQGLDSRSFQMYKEFLEE